MRISVVIPAHNAELYVADAIESCLNQTFLPHEVIVVDDASTDNTARIAESYPAPVRVIRLTQNLGVAGARNRGALESSGDWIAVLDADDWFLPHKLEAQKRCAERNPNARIIYTGFRVSKFGEEVDGYFAPVEDLPWKLRYRCPICVSTVMLRRDLFTELGGFDATVRIVEDWEFWLRIAERHTTKAFAAVPEPSAVYRCVAGGMSSSWIKMFKGREALVETRNLYGTTGIVRFCWRRLIRSFNYYEAAVALRGEGYEDYLGYMMKSLFLWPFPGKILPLYRYKITLVMIAQRCVQRVRGSASKSANFLRKN